MAGLNKVILIGNLGRDPELRYTQSQTPFARFSLATTESYTSNGEKVDKTTWHNLVVWGKQAEIAGRYLRKGKQIYVEGKIDYREYDDQSGQKRKITDIRVDRFLMLGPRGEGGFGGAPSGGHEGAPSSYGTPPSNAPSSNASSPPQQAPQSYGSPMPNYDIPESDDFSDDDIPF